MMKLEIDNFINTIQLLFFMQHILKCQKCNKYTMKKTCNCSGTAAVTIEIKPQKYSPEDKYGKYRREVKEEDRKKQGLL